MIGRASIGNPWIFREIKHYLATGEMLEGPGVEERVSACRTHLLESIKWKNQRVGILEMRRHYSNYFKGFPNFKEKRMQLVQSEDLDEILFLLNTITEERYEPSLNAVTEL
jgi:tRNA-dihydrouridine synthase